MAVTVADEWQGRGLGSVLGAHLAHLARNRGIRRFTATMASENTPAHRLMAKLTEHLEQHHVGERRGRAVARPGCLTLRKPRAVPAAQRCRPAGGVGNVPRPRTP